MNHDARHRYEWNTIPWHKLEVRVFKLQKRIYQATTRGETKKAHRLQKLLASSWSAKSLAVRRVTQENTGKKTAGVDGVKSLTPPKRLKLLADMDLHEPVKPVRRVWIDKPGKPEKRPLGIPIMHDRATQALVKLALEPEWEAKFEPNSFGFRPGRSCQDAIQQIFNVICKQPLPVNFSVMKLDKAWKRMPEWTLLISGRQIPRRSHDGTHPHHFRRRRWPRDQ